MRPSRTLPPLDRCLGVKPTQAANWRPFLNCRGFSDGPHERCGHNRTNSGTDASNWQSSRCENMSRSCVVSSANSVERRNLLQIHCAQSAQERRNGSVRVTDQGLQHCCAISRCWWRIQTLLREHAPDLVRFRRTLVDEPLSHPMQGLHGLLLGALNRNTVYISTSERGTDCRRVVGVVLCLRARRVFTYCVESSGPDVKLAQFASPIVGAVAGFNANSMAPTSRRNAEPPRDAVFVEAAACNWPSTPCTWNTFRDIKTERQGCHDGPPEGGCAHSLSVKAAGVHTISLRLTVGQPSSGHDGYDLLRVSVRGAAWTITTGAPIGPPDAQLRPDDPCRRA